MSRFCPNCGTEVDDTAVFCPTCGQPVDQETETEIPPAPAWPAPSPPAAPAEPAEPSRPEEPAEPVARDWERAPAAAAPEAPQPPRVHEPIPAEPPTRLEARQPSAPPPPADASSSSAPQINLPLTMPVTLSAWLIGGGAALAALGVLIGLFDGVLNPVELLLLVALIAIAVTVFFSGSIPEIPNLRLITFAVVLIGFGIALDRLSFGGAGVGELLLFLGSAAAAIGAFLLELGRDQPLGGPGG